MPENDGHTAIKEMKRAYSEIPVITFTASLIDNQRYQALLDSGFVDFVLKLFQPLNLLSKIRQHTLKKVELQ